MKTLRVLILEDDLETVSVLYRMLFDLEETSDHAWEFAVTTLAEYTQVREYVNKMAEDHWDIILLDRDCKACGSFHVLDIETFSPAKIVSISSTPQWNEEAKARGVSRIVLKNYENLEEFSGKVAEQVKEMLACEGKA